MSSSPPTKDIANTVYHAAVTTALAVLYSMVGKKIIRLDVGDPARPDFYRIYKVIRCDYFSNVYKKLVGESPIYPR